MENTLCGKHLLWKTPGWENTKKRKHLVRKTTGRGNTWWGTHLARKTPGDENKTKRQTTNEMTDNKQKDGQQTKRRTTNEKTDNKRKDGQQKDTSKTACDARGQKWIFLPNRISITLYLLLIRNKVLFICHNFHRILRTTRSFKS